MKTSLKHCAEYLLSVITQTVRPLFEYMRMVSATSYFIRAGLRGPTWAYRQWILPFAPAAETQTPGGAAADSDRRTGTRSPHAPGVSQRVCRAPSPGKKKGFNINLDAVKHHKCCWFKKEPLDMLNTRRLFDSDLSFAGNILVKDFIISSNECQIIHSQYTLGGTQNFKHFGKTCPLMKYN